VHSKQDVYARYFVFFEALLRYKRNIIVFNREIIVGLWFSIYIYY
jgi:hypothetical protein